MEHETSHSADAAQEGAGVDRRAVLLGSAAALSIPLAGVSAQGADVRAVRSPNIIYILADDLGWKDLGFRGSEIKTPNLDALAKTGAELQDFYVQPMCTPTRAALMTGRYPLR